jgi:hypothetical protein
LGGVFRRSRFYPRSPAIKDINMSPASYDSIIKYSKLSKLEIN